MNFMGRTSTRRRGLVFKETAEYLKVLEEYEERVRAAGPPMETLRLLTCLIEQNPSDYTRWVERRRLLRQVLEEKAYALEEELRWIGEIAQEHAKNYQVWHHFGYVVQALQHDVLEDGRIFALVSEEPKNIHFWGFFLSAVLARGDLALGLKYTEHFIEDDLRNNSPYSIRYTLLERLAASDPGVLEEEKRFLAQRACLRDNPAFWNYVRGLDRAHPGLLVYQACQAMLQERDLPQYYED